MRLVTQLKSVAAVFAILAFVAVVEVVAVVGIVASAGAQDISKDAPGAKKKKSTEVSFDDVLVQGKYHFSDEAVTTVEDDKILDALLGVRTDFKDRIKKSTARQ